MGLTTCIKGRAVESDTCKISLQVVKEVSGQSAGPEESGSLVIPQKTELEKVSVDDAPLILFRKTKLIFTAEA